MSTCPYLKLDTQTLRELWTFRDISIRKTKNSDGIQLRYRVPSSDSKTGYRQRSETYPSWGAAEAAAKRISDDLSAGSVPVRGAGLFAPLLSEALDHWAASRVESGLLPTSVTKDRVSVERLIHVVATQTKQPEPRVTALRPEHAMFFIKFIRETGVQTTTVQKHWCSASLFWRWAASWYGAQHNVIAPPPIKIKQTNEDISLKAHLVANYDLLAPAADILLNNKRLPGWGHYNVTRMLWAKCFTIMWGTGLRVSQAANLQWSDIDFTEGLIRVHRGCRTQQETALDRRVYAPEWLLEMLSDWERMSLWPVAIKDGKVAVNAIDQNRLASITHCSQRIWKAIELPREYWFRRSTHLIRKVYKTEVQERAAKAGVDNLFNLMEYQLGHSLGLVGVYTDVLRAHGPDLKAIANLCPDIREYAKGSRVSAVSRPKFFQIAQ
jgi:integrase